MASVEGKVSLVGAGPGDPGLMTTRALELIGEADVIFYDRLIPPNALAGARHDAELEYVGKMPGTVHNPQEEINRRLVEAARAGKSVVRLKGGDPFTFGRGGEEAEELARAGISFEVVPGVTAAAAAAATAGIPLTHRDDSAGVAFVTGHREAGADAGQGMDPDGSLARFPGTLVFYMGVKRLAGNAADLIAGGRPAGQPAAAIQDASTPNQRVVTATLGTIAARVEEAGIRPPALIVVGDVVRHHSRLAWFGTGPLAGRRVVVTRAKHQAGKLAALLRGQGAEVIEMPVIEIEPLVPDRDALDVFARGEIDLICFTSPNSIDRFFAVLDGELEMDARDLPPLVAAIGPSTARRLKGYGIRADIVPDRALAEDLLGKLIADGHADKRILIPRALEAREELPEGLRQAGAAVTVLPLYRTVPVAPAKKLLQRAAAADAITFTAASTVRNLLAAVPGGLPGPAGISIGPVTSEAMRKAGIKVVAEASRSDLDSLAKAVAVAMDAGVEA